MSLTFSADAYKCHNNQTLPNN